MRPKFSSGATLAAGAALGLSIYALAEPAQAEFFSGAYVGISVGVARFALSENVSVDGEFYRVAYGEESFGGTAIDLSENRFDLGFTYRF